MWQIRLELLPEGSKIVLGVMSPLFAAAVPVNGHVTRPLLLANLM